MLANHHFSHLARSPLLKGHRPDGESLNVRQKKEKKRQKEGKEKEEGRQTECSRIYLKKPETA